MFYDQNNMRNYCPDSHTKLRILQTSAFFVLYEYDCASASPTWKFSCKEFVHRRIFLKVVYLVPAIIDTCFILAQSRTPKQAAVDRSFPLVRESADCLVLRFVKQPSISGLVCCAKYQILLRTVALGNAPI